MLLFIAIVGIVVVWKLGQIREEIQEASSPPAEPDFGDDLCDARDQGRRKRS